jgi:hypothetical protein
MLADIYYQMLDEFGDTLEQTSIDSDERVNPQGRGIFITSNKKKVVNFDKFKDSIVAKYKLPKGPNSCDVLYMQSENKWFLIEFKNGKKKPQIKWKILHSLLLLTEKLDRTICFTRENLNFILVYNEDISRLAIGNSLNKLGSDPEFLSFGLEGLQKLYFKEVHMWTKEKFNSNFVEKYCTS